MGCVKSKRKDSIELVSEKEIQTSSTSSTTKAHSQQTVAEARAAQNLSKQNATPTPIVVAAESNAQAARPATEEKQEANNNGTAAVVAKTTVDVREPVDEEVIKVELAKAEAAPRGLDEPDPPTPTPSKEQGKPRAPEVPKQEGQPGSWPVDPKVDENGENALDLTAPASDALLKNRKNAWVQLAGHPGSFAPAGPNTIWKKRLSKENTETVAYQMLMKDSVHDIVPTFYREVEYNGDFFIEMEDLLQHFHDPNIMDIKMGTRTFLESEVKNLTLRKDLYEKMIKLAPNEPTEQEHEAKAITKLRYMQFRERGSSTSTLGFRIEAIRNSGEPPDTELKKVKSKEQIMQMFAKFFKGNTAVRKGIQQRFREMRARFETSAFFRDHEIIGSSLLVLYDKEDKVGVWMIDFAKTSQIEGITLNHRDDWKVGNHEDGYLTGLDSLIEILDNSIIDSMTNSPAASKHSVNSIHLEVNNHSTEEKLQT